jgi:hypothetical protein
MIPHPDNMPAKMHKDCYDRGDCHGGYRGDKRPAHGPLIFTSVNLKGRSPWMIGSYICSLILQIIGAYFISCLLFRAKGLRYNQKVLFTTIIGLIIGLLGVLPGTIWLGFSLACSLLTMIDLIISWFLAGLVMGKMIEDVS